MVITSIHSTHNDATLLHWRLLKEKSFSSEQYDATSNVVDETSGKTGLTRTTSKQSRNRVENHADSE